MAELTFDEFSRLRLSQTVDADGHVARATDQQPPCALASCVDLLVGTKVHLFAEVKSVAVERFGVGETLDRVLPHLEPLGDQVTLIASREDLLAEARARRGLPIGWILPIWSDEVIDRLVQLAPDTAFVNVRKVPESVAVLPDFGGRWVVYVVDEPAMVAHWLARGAALVETDRIDVLLAEKNGR